MPSEILPSRRALFKAGTSLAVLGLLPATAFAAGQPKPYGGRTDDLQAFDTGWCFYRGDNDAFADRVFDDKSWRQLDLPHDWSFDDLPDGINEPNSKIRAVDTAPIWEMPKDAPRTIGPFDQGVLMIGASSRSDGGRLTGFTVGGIGWYRKTFLTPNSNSGTHVELLFDGVYMNSEVWLNGVRLGTHNNGYTPFGYDLTPHLNKTGPNVLAVRVVNVGMNSRWYSGSGIYRHVWLKLSHPQRFAKWGVSVTTPVVSSETASVVLRAQVEGKIAGALVTIDILDSAGKLVAKGQEAAQAETKFAVAISHPSLWSPETPALYTAVCVLRVYDQICDRTEIPFGIRHVAVDAESGLTINGKSYKLRGGCIHHDNGLLGAVAIDRAEVRKIELLKARGFNAVRTAHNLPSPALLDACDRLGMLVLEEVYDCWNVPKNPSDSSLYFKDQWHADLEAMVRRDSNHPSIIMWGIGNEIPEVRTPDGVKTARIITEALRHLDPTRPITEAINVPNGDNVVRADGQLDQAATQFLDVAGYNYKLASYVSDHEKFPKRVLLGTESFPKDVVAIWKLTDKSPYLIGDFVWTAMDYLGEAGIGMSGFSYAQLTPTYPWFNAFCGDIDLIGQQKPQSLLRDVVWGVSALEVTVQRPLPEGKKEITSLWGWSDELQSWSWPDAEGKPLMVNIYTSGDEITLSLNGQVIAEKAVTDADNYVVRIPVPYASGRLMVMAKRGGKPIGQRVLESVGAPAKVRVALDRPILTSDRNDLAYATIEVLDAEERLIPDGVNVIKLSLDGPIELATFGNANPRGLASFQQPVAKTWHGRALAILRPTGKTGEATIKLESEGIGSAVAVLKISPA